MREAPLLGAHPVHGAEDEGDAQADEHARGVVVGGAPVAAQILQQQAAQLAVQRLRVPAGKPQRQRRRPAALPNSLLHFPASAHRPHLLMIVTC